MNYAEIVEATMVLLGETSEGSGTYESDQYAQAIQWAQEQVASLTGITYHEAIIPVTVRTEVTGETVSVVVIPSDVIKGIRVETPFSGEPLYGDTVDANIDGGVADSSNYVTSLDCGGA
jgi:hypothetical protein